MQSTFLPPTQPGTPPAGTLTKKRRLKLKLSKKINRPANDSNDDAARNELTPIKKRPDHTYANIDPDFFNDASSHSKRTTDKYPAHPMVKRPAVSVRFDEDKEPECSDDILDADSYDYVDNEWQSNASGSDYSSVPACRTSQATSSQVASALIHVHVHQTNQPDEDGQQSLYEHLKPVSKSDYLDFRGLSALGITANNSLSNSRPRLGETITLECNIVIGTAKSVTWYKDRNDTRKTVYFTHNCSVVAVKYKSRSKNVQCDTQNYNFQISEVQHSDSGEWQCEADGEVAKPPLELNVLVPPLTPTVKNPSPVKVGDSIKFTCNAENENVTQPIRYQWTKNGNNVLTRNIAPDGALLLSSVKKSDAGKYVCVAKNDAGSEASAEQDFVVDSGSESLQIKTTTASNSKSEKETETFTCEAIVDITVTSVKLILQNGTTNETLIEANSSVVTFRRQMMRQDNKVKFYCEATGPGIPNSLSSDIITYNVLFPNNVQVKVSKTTVNEHEFVRFECDTSGGNPELVKRYQWLWKKSGSTKEQVIQDTETSTQNGKYLEFTRIPYDKSGTYSCKAWNLGGMGQASTVLNVQYSPRIDPEAKMKYDVAGEIGKEAMFKLFIVANPSPTKTDYTWSKDGNVLSRTSPDYEITSRPTSSKLKIKNVKSLDYTNYSCSVKTSAFEAKIFNFTLNKAEATQSSKETNKTYKDGIGLIAVGGSLVVISIVIGIVIIVIKHKEKSSGRKKGDDQESQDNVVTDQSALSGGQVNHAMRLPLPRSECEPNENRKVAKSKLRTPDVVSDTNQYVESALHVPVGKNGSQKEVRPTLLRPTQPASPAKEHLYENVKRKIQPQQKSGSEGVPKQIGVDGTVYAKLSFQPAKHDHPVRRTEEPSPYSTVDFSRKAPPLEEKEEVLVQYIT
ncbi:titin-like [Lineus longissimus]|uniref:titin-like n=1 Tax=Lineus longissimus TaxID=88925 RepID=UPI00315D37A6